ncbi:septum formation family protein [Microbacterium sp. YMB-B2]|uniref:Septum formation family protein n=2 Tax=Microbacterium tenebrionis TaxID=2830665 RepID=A0A9X1LPU1_9MICO|nr:septum formation family protein [Microbacterium tenebrionis]
MMKMRTKRSLALAGSAMALSLALTGCSALSGILGGGDAQRDDDGNVTEGANIDVFSLKVGDCMPATDTTGEITDLDVVPCSEPHTDEVFYEFELEDGDLPSDDEIMAAVEAECVPAFADFVGVEWADSTLDFWWITPTEETWTQANDRIVQCVIYKPDPEDATGQTQLEVTGSLKDAAV